LTPAWIRWLNAIGCTTSVRGAHGRWDSAMADTPKTSKRIARGSIVRFISRSYIGKLLKPQTVESIGADRTKIADIDAKLRPDRDASRFTSSSKVYSVRIFPAPQRAKIKQSYSRTKVSPIKPSFPNILCLPGFPLPSSMSPTQLRGGAPARILPRSSIGPQQTDTHLGRSYVGRFRSLAKYVSYDRKASAEHH